MFYQTVDLIGGCTDYVLCSVQLARRVLRLERSNAALNKELDREKLQIQQLADQVSFFHCHIQLLIKP